MEEQVQEKKEPVFDKTPILKKELPKASFTVMPPKILAQRQVLPPKEEYEEVLKLIEQAKADQKKIAIIPHDLQDYAWQKLSQQGYKLKREILPRLVQINDNVDKLDQSRVQFTVDLIEFNRVD